MNSTWKTTTLGVISKINYGYTGKASLNTIGPKFLRITDIQNQAVNWETVPFCKMGNDVLPKYQLLDNDIVFARTGATTGKSFLITNPPLTIYASYLIRLKIIYPEILLPKFLFLYFQTSVYWSSIKNGLSGSAQGGFNASKLSEIVIPLPPIYDQQRIVSILEETFSAIAIAKEKAKKNIRDACAIFELYLQNIFTHSGDGWGSKTLKQIATIFGRGKSKHRPRNDKKLYNGKYPFIQTGDIRNSNHYITDYSQTYNDAGLSQSQLWPKGTICITIAANIAETGILNFNACFPDSIIGVVVNPEFAEIDFVEYLLQSFKSRLQEKGKGSAQDNINLATFENELFPFPSIPEQRNIVAKLNALSKKIKKLEAIYQQKLLHLEELKKSILHKAFNGEL